MRTTQLGIVIVMMIVGTPPDAARAQRINPENTHEEFCEARLGKNGMMLLIVINHEKAQDQKTGEDAARHFCRRMKIPERAGERSK